MANSNDKKLSKISDLYNNAQDYIVIKEDLPRKEWFSLFYPTAWNNIPVIDSGIFDKFYPKDVRNIGESTDAVLTFRKTALELIAQKDRHTKVKEALSELDPVMQTFAIESENLTEFAHTNFGTFTPETAILTNQLQRFINANGTLQNYEKDLTSMLKGSNGFFQKWWYAKERATVQEKLSRISEKSAKLKSESVSTLALAANHLNQNFKGLGETGRSTLVGLMRECLAIKDNSSSAETIATAEKVKKSMDSADDIKQMIEQAKSYLQESNRNKSTKFREKAIDIFESVINKIKTHTISDNPDLNEKVNDACDYLLSLTGRARSEEYKQGDTTSFIIQKIMFKILDISYALKLNQESGDRKTHPHQEVKKLITDFFKEFLNVSGDIEDVGNDLSKKNISGFYSHFLAIVIRYEITGKSHDLLFNEIIDRYNKYKDMAQTVLPVLYPERFDIEQHDNELIEKIKGDLQECYKSITQLSSKSDALGYLIKLDRRSKLINLFLEETKNSTDEDGNRFQNFQVDLQRNLYKQIVIDLYKKQMEGTDIDNSHLEEVRKACSPDNVDFNLLSGEEKENIQLFLALLEGTQELTREQLDGLNKYLQTNLTGKVTSEISYDCGKLAVDRYTRNLDKMGIEEGAREDYLQNFKLIRAYDPTRAKAYQEKLVSLIKDRLDQIGTTAKELPEYSKFLNLLRIYGPDLTSPYVEKLKMGIPQQLENVMEVPDEDDNDEDVLSSGSESTSDRDSFSSRSNSISDSEVKEYTSDPNQSHLSKKQSENGLQAPSKAVSSQTSLISWFFRETPDERLMATYNTIVKKEGVIEEFRKIINSKNEVKGDDILSFFKAITGLHYSYIQHRKSNGSKINEIETYMSRMNKEINLLQDLFIQKWSNGDLHGNQLKLAFIILNLQTLTKDPKDNDVKREEILELLTKNKSIKVLFDEFSNMITTSRDIEINTVVSLLVLLHDTTQAHNKPCVIEQIKTIHADLCSLKHTPQDIIKRNLVMEFLRNAPNFDDESLKFSKQKLSTDNAPVPTPATGLWM